MFLTSTIQAVPSVGVTDILLILCKLLLVNKIYYYYYIIYYYYILFFTSLCLSVAGVYSRPDVEPYNFVDNGQLNVNYECKDTLKTEEVLAWYMAEGSVLTPQKEDIKIYVFDVKDTSAVVPVRAAKDAIIHLNNENGDYVYEIGIGVDDNTESYIRKYYKDQIRVPTPEILTEDEFRRFRISWDKGLIRVIAMWRQGDDSTLLEWQDPEPVPIKSYGISTLHGSIGSFKVPGWTWGPNHILLSVIQHHGDEQLVTLPLNKTLEDSDSDKWLYCAKTSVERGGHFAQLPNWDTHPTHGSIRIQIEFKKSRQPLETPIIKLEPNHDIVNFTENSTLTLTCSGSPPVDGRTYTWFRKVSDSDSNLTLPETQSYDATTRTNVLTLTPDESYNHSQLFCRLGYVAHITDPDGVVVVLSYGAMATSKDIFLNFTETFETEDESDDLPVQMWVALVAMLATMLIVAVVTCLLLMACVPPTCRTEEREK